MSTLMLNSQHWPIQSDKSEISAKQTQCTQQLKHHVMNSSKIYFCCVSLPPVSSWHTEVRPRSVGNTTWWAPLAGHAREDHLQAGRHGVPLSAWSSTSVPRWPSHSSLWRRFPASSPFREPTATSRTSLSTWHVRPSGFLHCWSDSMEFVTWRTQRPDAWFRQFSTVPQDNLVQFLLMWAAH